MPISGINGGYAPGSGAPAVNAGKVKNSGFELVLNYKDNISDFKYDLGFNITTINNEVLEVNNSTNYIEGGAFAIGQLPPTRMEVGQPIGYFYGYKMDGIFQNQAEIDAHPSQIALGANAAPGDIRYVDINGDGVEDVLIPRGIIWKKGESDADKTEQIANQYYSNLKRLMDLMKAAFRDDDLPVVIGKISDSGDDTDGKVWGFGELVQYSQEKFAATEPNAAIVRTTNNYKYSDKYHKEGVSIVLLNGLDA